MDSYSTTILLKLLVKLLLVQIGALKLKHLTDAQWDKVREGKYPSFAKRWYLREGICANIHRVDKTETANTENQVRDLLHILFRKCPSGTGSGGLPVRPAEQYGRTVGYGFSSKTTWGDHPYADNRRQIITECIEQLETELRARKVKV
jgi:hypothetical protein